MEKFAQKYFSCLPKVVRVEIWTLLLRAFVLGSHLLTVCTLPMKSFLTCVRHREWRGRQEFRLPGDLLSISPQDRRCIQGGVHTHRLSQPVSETTTRRLPSCCCCCSFLQGWPGRWIAPHLARRTLFDCCRWTCRVTQPVQRTSVWLASWLPAVDKSRGSKSVEVQRVWEIFDERLQFVSRQDAMRLNESF